MKTTTQDEVLAGNGMHRRSFLKFAGAGAVAAGILATAACQDPVVTQNDPTQQDLGTGDIAVLNYAYALEQLEAAFYVQVLSSPTQASLQKSVTC